MDRTLSEAAAMQKWSILQNKIITAYFAAARAEVREMKERKVKNPTCHRWFGF